MGQLGIGGQGGDFEEHSQRQVGDVDVGERRDLGPVAGQQGKGDIEDEEEHDEGADADAHVATDEWSPVPPSVVGMRACLFGHHRLYVPTPGPPDLTC